jgi:hypothetical protein
MYKNSPYCVSNTVEILLKYCKTSHKSQITHNGNQAINSLWIQGTILGLPFLAGE